MNPDRYNPNFTKRPFIPKNVKRGLATIGLAGSGVAAVVLGPNTAATVPRTPPALTTPAGQGKENISMQFNGGDMSIQSVAADDLLISSGRPNNQTAIDNATHDMVVNDQTAQFGGNVYAGQELTVGTDANINTQELKKLGDQQNIKFSVDPTPKA